MTKHVLPTRRLLPALAVAVSLVGAITLVAGPADAGGTPGRLLAVACGAEEGAPLELIDIPVDGGEATLIGEVTGLEDAEEGQSCPTGLAYDPGTGSLVSVSISTGAFAQIPLTAGEADVIDTIDVDSPCGLERDPDSGLFWTFSYEGGQLFTVTPEGLADEVGATSITGPCSAAFDPATGTLYAISYDTGTLYEVDPTDGSATVIGETETDDICGLAYDTDTDRLLAVLDEDDSPLLEISTTDAAVTPLGNTGFDTLCGLAYVPAEAPPTTTTTAAPTTTTTATTTTAAAAARVTPRFTG